MGKRKCGHEWQQLPGGPRVCLKCDSYECMNERCEKTFPQGGGQFKKYCSLVCGNRQRVREASRK